MESFVHSTETKNFQLLILQKVQKISQFEDIKYTAFADTPSAGHLNFSLDHCPLNNNQWLSGVFTRKPH